MSDKFLGRKIEDLNSDILAEIRSNETQALSEFDAMNEECKKLLLDRLEFIYEGLKRKSTRLHEMRESIQLGLAIHKEAERVGFERGIKLALGSINVTQAPSQPQQPAQEPIQHNGRDERASQPWDNFISAYHESNRHTAKAKKNYGTSFNRFRKVVGDKPLCDITTDDVRLYRDFLAQDISPKHGKESAGSATITRQLTEIKSWTPLKTGVLSA